MNERTKLILTILCMSLMIVGVIVFINSLIYAIQHKENPVKNEVKCFDRFSNEIIGQTCIEESFPINNKLSVITFLSLVSIGYGLKLFVMVRLDRTRNE